MTIHFGWPQGIMIGLMLTGLILAARDHDKPRGPDNFWVHLVAAFVTAGLLVWGGFFR